MLTAILVLKTNDILRTLQLEVIQAHLKLLAKIKHESNQSESLPREKSSS